MTANEMAESNGTQSRVEVLGSTQRWLINKPIIKVYWNGDKVGAVQHGGQFTFEVVSDGEIRFKYSARSAELGVKSGGVTKIQLSWDRIRGRLVAQVVDPVSGER